MPYVTLGRRDSRAAAVSTAPHAGDRRVAGRVIGAVPNAPPRQLDAVENLISSIWSRRWPSPIWFAPLPNRTTPSKSDRLWSRVSWPLSISLFAVPVALAIFTFTFPDYGPARKSRSA